MIDGKAQSDIRQGVTLEVMGEGFSMGPLNDEMKRLGKSRQGDFKYEIDWTTLGEYLTKLEKKGISPNVASFVGATSVRVHVLGEDDVDPTPAQLAEMREAGPRGHGGRRHGRRLLADLCARQLRRDARADRPGRGGRQVRRHVHQPHAQRGRPAGRGGRRADRDLAQVRRPGRDLPPQGRGQGQLGQARHGDRADRGGPRRRACGSPPTCTPTPPAPPGSTPPCRPGCRRAGWRSGSSG